MKILIFGATGATGRELVKQALDRGYHVTAYARNPQKLNIISPLLTIIKGELEDKKLISYLLHNKDAVFSTLGASSMFTYDQAVVNGIQSIVKLMNDSNANRLIYLSFAGVHESRHQAGAIIKHIAPKFLSTEIRRHEDCEKIIRQSNLTWTIVRPATLTNNKPKGSYRSGETIVSNKFMTSISRADTAHFMLDQLNDLSFIKNAPLIFN